MTTSILLKVDQRAKRVISVLYRILIVVYGFMLFYLFKERNELFEYLLVALVYFVVFLIAHGKEGFSSYFRLIADYLFIFFIVRTIPIDNFYVSVLIFLPILNSSNHTSRKRSSLLYVIPILYLTIYRKFSLFIIIPYVLFFIVNFFGVIRFMYISFNEHLNSLIDNFLISPESVEKPHKIYEKAINVFNESSLILFEVDKIMCFKIKNENIIPVNASLFIWNFTVDDDLIVQIVNSPKGSYFAFHSNLIINGISFPKNYLFTYRIGDTIYCYFILPRKQNFIFDNELMPYFNELVAPFFSRTSKIFEAYSERKRLEIEAIVQMESKISYVQNAKSSMHFIRNKLGPLTNYLAMVTDYEQSDSKANKSALKAIIDDERSKLSTSVDEILKRAHYILDRSNNPFLVNQLSDHSIKKLYSEVKRVWESYFNVFDPSLNWNVTRDNYVIKFNTIGLDFVLVNWINNMKKYGGGKQFVTLDEDPQFIILDFSNSIKDLLGATDAVHAFQSNDRIEILQRNTHGIVEIIDFLNQMNISYNAHIKSNKLHLILKFIKHYTNEDIDF